MILLLVILVIGIAAGYGVNNYFASRKIKSLEEDVENKDNQIASLQTSIGQLEESVTSLTTSLSNLEHEYEDLSENTVPKTQYDALEVEHIVLTRDYEELEEDYSALQTQTSALESTIENLTEDNQELSEEYEDLLTKYNEIRVLSWTYFEVNNLKVNLTTTTTNYPISRPIKGTVSIYHEDDQPFNGTVELTSWSYYFATGRSSDEFSISGQTDYTFDDPFVQGPGTYYLRISVIRDDDGKTIVGYQEAKEYDIKITMG